MQTRTWTLTTIQDGRPVATRTGLDDARAASAIYAAMHGQDPFRHQGARLVAVDAEPAQAATKRAA